MSKRRLFDAQVSCMVADYCMESNNTAVQSLSPPQTPATSSYRESRSVSPEEQATEEVDGWGWMFVKTASYDDKLFELRKQSPDSVAYQLTLHDMALFRRIHIEEFQNCGWMDNENKHKLAPNILNFTQHFNHVCFWVEQEILKEHILKLRTEMVTFFIKIAKRLHDLRNFHSMMAVLAALQSAAIYRLSQTWKAISKRDRQTFEKLVEVASPEENHHHLRELMEKLVIPTIPHLGLYLMDLSYLYTKQKAAAQSNADKQIENVLSAISFYQNSQYDLRPQRQIMSYLSSINFIDELQKIIEADFFQKSKELEPDTIGNGSLATSRSSDDILGSSSCGSDSKSSTWRARQDKWMRKTDSWTRGKHDPRPDSPKVVHRSMLLRSFSTSPQPDLPSSLKANVEVTITEGSPTVSRSRRVLSPDPSDLTGLTDSLPTDTMLCPSSPNTPKKKPFGAIRGHRKSRSLGANVLHSLGIGISKAQSPKNGTDSAVEKSVSLIDDSVLDHSPAPSGSESSDEEEDDDGDDYGFIKLSEAELTQQSQKTTHKEGLLKYLILKRNSKSVKTPFQRKRKCKGTLTDSALILLKEKKGKVSPHNVRAVPLKGTLVSYTDPNSKTSDKHFIMDTDKGLTVRFTAATPSEAEDWVTVLREAIKLLQISDELKNERSLIDWS